MAIDDRKLRPIHEDILLDGMAMEVQKHQQVVSEDGLVLGNKLFEGIHFRKNLFFRVTIFPIEILAGYTCPIVAHGYSIRVQHRNNLKNNVFPELSCLFRVAAKKIDESFHHV